MHGVERGAWERGADRAGNGRLSAMDTVWRSLFFGDAGYTAEDRPECFAPMTHAPHPPSLFSVELRTPRWELLVDWYRDILGLKVLLRVVDDHYALLDAGSTRLAIMGRPTAGEPSGRWSLGFETDDLDAVWHRLGAAAAPPRANPEGFRELVAFDPDGNKVRLFSWSPGHHA